MKMLRALLATPVVLALAGCGSVSPAPVEISQPVRPLSKVYVQNADEPGRHVRMNWPDGFVQVSWIQAGTTQGLTGAIGTSGFPETIDVLTEDRRLITRMAGLSPGEAGIVVISNDEATLHRLVQADASWGVAPSIRECGATPVE